MAAEKVRTARRRPRRHYARQTSPCCEDAAEDVRTVRNVAIVVKGSGPTSHLENAFAMLNQYAMSVSHHDDISFSASYGAVKGTLTITHRRKRR